MPAKLYLIPSPISDETIFTIPTYAAEIVKGLRHFIVEEEAAAQRFLKKLIPRFPAAEFSFFVWNEHSAASEAQEYFKTIHDNEVGLISEAGAPCVADPGASIVLLAHQNNTEVIPLVGPSSILLALMASGLNGQNFVFHGYLPKDQRERTQKIKTLEQRSRAEGQTQIFMETPYRNQKLFDELLSTCQNETFLSLATDLTGKEQSIKTLRVKEWKKIIPPIHKKPTIFLVTAPFCNDRNH